MKFSVGIWDAIFGEKLTVEVPLDDGTTKKKKVTKKWFEKMKEKGKIEEIGTEITVHMLGIYKYKKEKWIVGKDIKKDTYDKFREEETGDIYGMRLFEDGEIKTYFISKDRWLEGKKELGY